MVKLPLSKLKKHIKKEFSKSKKKSNEIKKRIFPFCLSNRKRLIIPLSSLGQIGKQTGQKMGKHQKSIYGRGQNPKSLANLAPQFQKGVVANPNGRPKGSLSELMIKEMDNICPHDKNKRTWRELIVIATIQLAIKGNATALKEVWDRVDGLLARKDDGTSVIIGGNGLPTVVVLPSGMTMPNPTNGDSNKNLTIIQSIPSNTLTEVDAIELQVDQQTEKNISENKIDPQNEK
jgi:hypothetical protein